MTYTDASNHDLGSAAEPPPSSVQPAPDLAHAQPEANNANVSVWSWAAQTNGGSATQVAILTASNLYISGALSKGQVRKLNDAIEQGDAAIEARMSKGLNQRGKTVARTSIESVVFTEQSGKVTIGAAGKNHVATLMEDGAAKAFAEEFAATLGMTNVDNEVLGAGSKAGQIAAFAGGGLAFGGAVIFFDQVAEEGYVATGTRAGLKEMLNDLMLTIPAAAAFVIAGVIAAIGIAMAVRYLNDDVTRTTITY